MDDRSELFNEIEADLSRVREVIEHLDDDEWLTDNWRTPPTQ